MGHSVYFQEGASEWKCAIKMFVQLISQATMMDKVDSSAKKKEVVEELILIVPYSKRHL